MKFSTIVPAYDPSWTPKRVKGRDLAGHRYGRLWVIRDSGERTASRDKKWLCSCSCGSGRLSAVVGQKLRSGHTRSCGCLQVESNAAKKGKTVDRSSLVGRKFGRLTVVEDSGKRAVGNVIYSCICECGNTSNVRAYALKNGDTTSCGCYFTEQNYSHGLYSHYLYRTWANMVARCHKPSSISYPNYGGRGISVHAAWRDEPTEFINWIDGTLGERPEGHSLDRIDNDGNYEPDNLRWADAETQTNNRRCSPKNKKV